MSGARCRIVSASGSITDQNSPERKPNKNHRAGTVRKGDLPFKTRKLRSEMEQCRNSAQRTVLQCSSRSDSGFVDNFARRRAIDSGSARRFLGQRGLFAAHLACAASRVAFTSSGTRTAAPACRFRSSRRMILWTKPVSAALHESWSRSPQRNSLSLGNRPRAVARLLDRERDSSQSNGIKSLRRPRAERE